MRRVPARYQTDYQTDHEGDRNRDQREFGNAKVWRRLADDRSGGQNVSPLVGSF